MYCIIKVLINIMLYYLYSNDFSLNLFPRDTGGYWRVSSRTRCLHLADWNKVICFSLLHVLFVITYWCLILYIFLSVSVKLNFNSYSMFLIANLQSFWHNIFYGIICFVWMLLYFFKVQVLKVIFIIRLRKDLIFIFLYVMERGSLIFCSESLIPEA